MNSPELLEPPEAEDYYILDSNSMKFDRPTCYPPKMLVLPIGLNNIRVLQRIISK